MQQSLVRLFGEYSFNLFRHCLMFRYSTVQCAINVFWIQWEPCFWLSFCIKLGIFFSHPNTELYHYVEMSFSNSLKSIWHEHSFLSVKRLLLKNSKLKIWEKLRLFEFANFPLKIWSFLLLGKRTKEITTVKGVWICDPNYHKIRRTFAQNFSKNYQCFEKLYETFFLVFDILLEYWWHR